MDRYVVLPSSLSFVVHHPSTGDAIEQRFSWREMFMNVLLQDERASQELNHFERAEIAAVARGGPNEVVRIGGKPHEVFGKIMLDTSAFDAHVTQGGSTAVLRGFFAQQPETIGWMQRFFDASVKDPRTVASTNHVQDEVAPAPS